MIIIFFISPHNITCEEHKYLHESMGPGRDRTCYPWIIPANIPSRAIIGPPAKAAFFIGILAAIKTGKFFGIGNAKTPPVFQLGILIPPSPTLARNIS